MRGFQCVAIASFALVVSGCATYQSPDSDPSIACMVNVESLPELAPLKAKLGSLRGASQDLDVMADTSAATQAEKPLLKLWHSARIACMNEGDVFRATKTIPGYVGLVSDHTGSMNRLIAKLYQGEMSFGEFASQRAQVYETLNSSVNRLYQEFAANEKQENRQAAMTYLMLQSAMPRPAAPATTYQIVQPPPVYIPPKTFNCNSYTYGVNTQTTCR